MGKANPDLSKRATLLLTTAGMMWSPLTRGELFGLLVYMVENYDEVITAASPDVKPKKVLPER